MDTPHGKIIEETEYRMLYDEEFILLSESTSLKIIYFTYFQSLLQFGIIFWGTTINLSKALILQKRIMRVMLGLRQRTSCREKFKKLYVLTVPSLYGLILEMMMFVIKNPEKYQTNDSIHSKDMRQI